MHAVEIRADGAALDAANFDNAVDMLENVLHVSRRLFGKLLVIEVYAYGSALRGDCANLIVGQRARMLHHAAGVGMRGKYRTRGSFQNLLNGLVADMRNVYGNADAAHFIDNLLADGGKPFIAFVERRAAEFVVVVPCQRHGAYAKLAQNAQHRKTAFHRFPAFYGQNGCDLPALRRVVFRQRHELGVLLKHAVINVDHGDALVQRRRFKRDVDPAGEKLQRNSAVEHVAEFRRLFTFGVVEIIAGLNCAV